MILEKLIRYFLKHTFWVLFLFLVVSPVDKTGLKLAVQMMITDYLILLISAYEHHDLLFIGD